MSISTLSLIIRKTRKDLFRERLSRVIVIVVLLFSIASIVVAFSKYSDSRASVEEYRQETRKNWESRPDKHPHRMAHYGYLVFRLAHPLQIFDVGLDDFLGNVIFLEAHKQNTANLSEAGSSGTLVRFGSFTSAFILQTIVPLILLFLGFGLVAREREDATLKLLNVQGLSSRTILWGKVIGLWQFSLLFLLPLFPVVFVATTLLNVVGWSDVLIRLLLLLPAYMAFYFFVSSITVVISAISRNATMALVSLIGCWLLLILFLPKIIQFAAQNIYPTPSRVAFETEVERDVLKVGDSHNPDDPHFKHIKDSLLAKYHVKTTDELPINYGGIIMKEGERISAAIYADHLRSLHEQYNRQQRLTDLFGFINPAISIRSLSMSASGTDYQAYAEFQLQAERYRYKLAQHMNNLQIEHISNVKGKEPAIISKSNWQEFPDFHYSFVPLKYSIAQQCVSILALALWLIVSCALVEFTAKKLQLI